jgi:hypothetical protein
MAASLPGRARAIENKPDQSFQKPPLAHAAALSVYNSLGRRARNSQGTISEQEQHMANAYLISGCRTPMGKLLGSLAPVPAPKLGGVAIAESLRRAGVDPA